MGLQPIGVTAELIDRLGEPHRSIVVDLVLAGWRATPLPATRRSGAIWAGAFPPPRAALDSDEKGTQIVSILGGDQRQVTMMTTGLAEEAITTRSTAMSATGSPRRAISSNRVPSAFDLLGERAPLPGRRWN